MTDDDDDDDDDDFTLSWLFFVLLPPLPELLLLLLFDELFLSFSLEKLATAPLILLKEPRKLLPLTAVSLLRRGEGRWVGGVLGQE